jgi:hypothetical protein
LRKQIKTLRSLLTNDVTLEEFEAERNKLDLLKEDVNEAHTIYGDVLTLEEDKDSSYKWFNQCHREFQEFRARVTEKIHVLERDISSRRVAPSIQIIQLISIVQRDQRIPICQRVQVNPISQKVQVNTIGQKVQLNPIGQKVQVDHRLGNAEHRQRRE